MGLNIFFAKSILKSTAKLSILSSSFTFKGQNYAITAIILNFAALPSLVDLDSLVCLDARCVFTLVDRVQLNKKLFLQKISSMPIPLKIKGIGVSKYILGEFSLTIINISDINKKGQQTYTFIGCKLYLVNRLKTNMLIDNDVLYMKSFTIVFSSTSSLIHSCGVV